MRSRATRKRRTGSFDRSKKISRSEEEVRVVCTLCKKKISPSPFVSSETRSISTFPIRPSKFSRSPFLSDSLEIYHLDNKDFSRPRRKLSRRGLTTIIGILRWVGYEASRPVSRRWRPLHSRKYLESRGGGKKCTISVYSGWAGRGAVILMSERCPTGRLLSQEKLLSTGRITPPCIRQLDACVCVCVYTISVS